ncbi:MAG: class I SAM-dependent methyltransferase [Planctomycetota bacterium]|jgi:predicted SAM-dependent methyltransferase
MTLIDFVCDLIRETDTVLDIGCGDKCYERKTKRGKFFTVDAHAELKPTWVVDLEKTGLPFGENLFDIVLMLDFIEHLTKERGMAILKQAKWIAKRMIILSTPAIWTTNEDNVQHEAWENNPYNRHKSLWSGEDFEGNWIGVTGLKNLQNQYVRIWYK